VTGTARIWSWRDPGDVAIGVARCLAQRLGTRGPGITADCVDDHLDYDRDVFGGLVEPDRAGNGQQEGQVAEHGAEDVHPVRVVVLDLVADGEGGVGRAGK
jgi:hypothetical protein